VRSSPVVATSGGRGSGGDISGKEVDDDMLTSTGSFSRCLARIAFVVVLVTAMFDAPAAADCLLDYVSCVEAASDLGNFGRRSLAGVGCYLNLISCLERRLA
jgi:hypothetical protein